MTITVAFLNQKTANVCEHTIKAVHMAYSAVFTMCSHSFTVFWLRKTSVIVEMFQLSFCMFTCVCAFCLEISSFFGRNFLFLFLFFELVWLMKCGWRKSFAGIKFMSGENRIVLRGGGIVSNLFYHPELHLEVPKCKLMSGR